MSGGEPTAELARLLQEIVRLEAYVNTASLRHPQTLAEYVRVFRQVRCQCEDVMDNGRRPMRRGLDRKG